MKVFFDTNILVYGQQLGSKADIARHLMSSGGTISVQVLNEFTSVARRKLGYDWSEIAEAVDDALAVFVPPVPLTTETHAAAVELARDHDLSFYDALIVAAAISADCATLYSEDLQHGRKFEQLTVVNPFGPE